MAEMIFRPFIEINGILLRRGDPIIVGWRSRLRTAHVVDIRENNDGFFVTANVDLGSDKFPGATNPIEYVDTGFEHLSNSTTGNKFVLPEEGEEACVALNALLDGRARETAVDPSQIDVGKPGGGLTDADAVQVKDTDPLPESESFHPADKDKDGLVSKQERKQFNRENS